MTRPTWTRGHDDSPSADDGFGVVVIETGIQDESTFVYRKNDPALAWQRAVELGAKTVRFIAYESYVARMGWRNWTNAVEEALRAGIRPQVVLTGCPSWDKQPGKLSYYRPDPAVYAEFIKEAVATLGAAGCRRFSIWNEPNHPNFLGGPADAPSRGRIYSRLYHAGYAAGRAEAGPGAEFLFGELSSMPGAVAFLNAAAEGHETDGFALHPYQFKTPPRLPVPLGGRMTFGDIPAAKRQLTRLAKRGDLVHHRGPAPLYLTEFGYFVAGWGKQSIPESRRARYVEQAVALAKKWDAKQIVYYHLWTVPKGVAWNTGIINGAGSPTPTFEALRRAYGGHG